MKSLCGSFFGQFSPSRTHPLVAFGNPAAAVFFGGFQGEGKTLQQITLQQPRPAA